MKATVTGAVPVGQYSLELGSAGGSFALFETRTEQANTRELDEALCEPIEQGDATATEEPLEDASAITARCERSVRLFNALAQGHALDAKVISDEVDALVALVGRLDQAGRHKEALRLARNLSALLALLLRWIDLVRSLRLALRIARSLGDRPGEAWALHELGSLHLCAGDPDGASERLREAVRIKDELGGGYGRCASRHNLDAATRDLASREKAPKRRRARRLPLVAAAFVLALLMGGGTALGLALTASATKPFVPPDATTTSATSPSGARAHPPKARTTSTTRNTPATTSGKTKTSTAPIHTTPPSDTSPPDDTTPPSDTTPPTGQNPR